MKPLVDLTVREVRERLGLSLDELAAAAGVSRAALARIETGETVRPRPATLAAVVRVLALRRGAPVPADVTRRRPTVAPLTVGQALDYLDARPLAAPAETGTAA